MTAPLEEDGEAYTLGLLQKMRALCDEMAASQDEYAYRFHELMRSISSSNTPDVADELTFRVTGYVGRSRNSFRTMSLNGNVTVAKAAYEATIKLYPNDRWTLHWGPFVIEDSMPLPLGD